MAVPKKAIRTIETVVSRVSDSNGVRKLVLKQPDGWDLPKFQPGAHIDIHLPVGQVRSYSLCGDPGVQTEYIIAVRKDLKGRGGSTYVHERLKEGDTVAISLPRCTFPLTEPSKVQMFIAGGIGVTPFISMAYALDALKQHYELHVFYRRHIPLAVELQNVGVAGKVFLHDTESSRGDSRLRQLLDKPIHGAHVYCCGPLNMISEFKRLTADWTADTIHEEHFTAPDLEPLDNSYELVLRKSNLTLSIPPQGNALQAILDAGIELDSSCEGGICGACRVTWLEGEPIHRDRCLSDAQRSRYFIPCVGGCSGSRLVIDL